MAANRGDGHAVRGLARQLGAFLVLPNLLFLLLAQRFYLERSLINIDYLVLGATAPWLPRIGTAVACAVIVLADLAGALAPVYHFQLDDVVASTQFLSMLDGWLALLFGALASTAVVAGLVAAVAGRPRRDTSYALVLLSLAGLVVVFDFANGTNRYSSRNSVMVPINLSTSAVFRTAIAIRDDLRPTVRDTGYAVESATAEVLAAVRSGRETGAVQRANIVLVIVESLGQFKRPSQNVEVLAPLLSEQVRRRYAIQRGTIPFSGNTTRGELRELCGLFIDYRAATSATLDSCLPAYLSRRSFRTFAIHGFTRTFFDRWRWYPLLGFDSLMFAEQLAPGLPGSYCGTFFRGICDEDAARALRATLLGGRGRDLRFVYWLTLNSHLPVDRASARGSSFSCADDPDALLREDLCLSMRIWRKVSTAIAAIALDPDLPPTEFIVVGDHSPPFRSKTTRALFAAHQVPYVALVPIGSLMPRRGLQ